MSKPVRIQRKRIKGWKMPPNTVSVTRPSIWGNPYTHPDPQKAVDAFREHCGRGTKSFHLEPGGLQFAKRMHPNALHWAYGHFVQENIRTLRGKNLACWCPILDQQNNYTPCHADVLLSLANDTPIDEVIRENTRRAKGETL